MLLNKINLLRGDEIQIADKLIMKIKTVGEIVDYGEQNYDSILLLFCAKPYDLKVQLWDNGIDYVDLNSYDLFLMLSNDKDDISNKLNWLFNSNFEFDFYINQQNNETVLFDKANDIIIDRLVYENIRSALMQINFKTEKNEFNPGNKMARKMLIDQDRRRLNKLAKNQNKDNSWLDKIISSVKWSSNESYESIWQLNIYQLLDGFYRLNKIKEYENLMNGVYSGTVDAKEIKNKDLLQWHGKITI